MSAVEVTVDKVPGCDICRCDGNTVAAEYDSRLPGLGGSWGFVCQAHFDKYGPGTLGTGSAQRLVKR